MDANKAIVWELALQNGRTQGVRLAVVGHKVAQQELRRGNERPRWTVTTYPSQADAIAAATAFTQQAESDYHGTILIAPVEVMVHPAEYARLEPGSPIPPAFRARMFSSLHRRRDNS